jgi:hypothetical protein
LVDFEPIQDGQVFRRNEDLDTSGDAGLTLDETVSLERHDHLMDRGRADLKVAPHDTIGTAPLEAWLYRPAFLLCNARSRIKNDAGSAQCDFRPWRLKW